MLIIHNKQHNEFHKKEVATAGNDLFDYLYMNLCTTGGGVYSTFIYYIYISYIQFNHLEIK